MKVNRATYQDNLSDKEIWNLFRSGSDAAFEYLYETYFDKLYNYGCQFTKDHALVEDTLQELFIELRKRGKHLSETDKVLPYLCSAFRRKIIRYRTKLSRFKELDSQNSFLFESSIEQSLIEKDHQEAQKARLQQSLGTLSEKHREIIYLFYYENLSYEEIQEIQGFDNIKSARNLLYKALKSLRKSLLTLTIIIVFSLFSRL